jgi:DNA polymerase elongation subunit (family B)
MTYISASLSKDRKHVNVWERENGKRVTKNYEAPYYFYIQNKDGIYRDIYNNPVTKLEFDDGFQFYEARKEYKERNIKLLESDISPIYKVLSNEYYKREVNQLNITMFDIEVDYSKEGGFPSPENPYAPVSAVSIYHHYSDRMLMLVVLPSNGKWEARDIPADLHDISEIIVCKTEKELLLRFLDEIENSDVISGWNSAGYDVPYLYERMKNRYDITMANRLSFHNAPAPKPKEVEVFIGSKRLQTEIFGRVHIDYLEIFKKFETTTRPSFTLDAISEEVCPEFSKLEYDGSLYDLYYENFPHFCRYNVRDTEVLKSFEEKLGYIGLAIESYHAATALAHDVLGTIKIVECTMINKCHHVLDVIVPDSKEQDYGMGNDKFAGALVLDPITGLHTWVFATDVKSLYPSAIRALNASPETLIGQFHGDYLAYEYISDKTTNQVTLITEKGESETHAAYEWPAILKSRKYSISGYGTVFNQNQKGFIPEILEEWYTDRIAFQARKKAAGKKMKDIVDKTSAEYLAQSQEYAYCNRVQFILKILLNSTYGACGNKFFKFYDLRIAESTTRTGREVLMHMVRTVALNLDGKYAYPSPSCIYSDTDSCYAKSPTDNLEDTLKLAKIIEKKVNAAFIVFTAEKLFCNEGYDTLIQAELDIIADRSVFIKKKMYIMHLLYSDGVPCDKMKVMGLQIKKTTIPKPISKMLTSFLEDYLKGSEWKSIARRVVDYKDVLINDKITMIGLPKGIKGIEDYTARYNLDKTTRLPGHVAAAMFYNKCLEVYDDKESTKIVSGMKIKTYYLTKKFDRFKSIAIPTDMKTPPDWFVKHFAPLIDRNGQLDRLVDRPLQAVLTAIGEISPTRKTLMVDDLFEY